MSFHPFLKGFISWRKAEGVLVYLFLLALAWPLAQGQEEGLRQREGASPGPLDLRGWLWLPDACVHQELEPVRIPARAPFLISLFHPLKPRKSCKVRKNTGICSMPQNRADIVLAFQSSFFLTTQMVPISFQRLSVVF